MASLFENFRNPLALLRFYGVCLFGLSIDLFTKSLAERSDVRFCVDHEGLILARTSAGTLRLSTDDIGLLSDASLDPASPYAQSVISAVRRGDMSQMSHSFRCVRQTWSDDYRERRIQEIAMFDTSVVGFPANPVTAIALDQRALDPAAEAAEVRGDFAARQRIERHMAEMAVEHRASDTGAFSGLVVPQYLTDQVAPYARAGRPFADAVRNLPLPAEGLSVNISRITTGSTEASQS